MRSYSSIYAIDDSSRKFALGGENFSLYLTALLRWSSSMINDYQTYKLALQGFSDKKKWCLIGPFLHEYLNPRCLLIACVHYRMYGGMSELARNLGVEIEFLDHSSRGPHRRYYTKADQIASATSGDIVRGILNGGVEVGNIRADSTFGELLGLTRGEIIIP